MIVGWRPWLFAGDKLSTLWLLELGIWHLRVWKSQQFGIWQARSNWENPRDQASVARLLHEWITMMNLLGDCTILMQATKFIFEKWEQAALSTAVSKLWCLRSLMSECIVKITWSLVKESCRDLLMGHRRGSLSDCPSLLPQFQPPWDDPDEECHGNKAEVLTSISCYPCSLKRISNSPSLNISLG